WPLSLVLCRIVLCVFAKLSRVVSLLLPDYPVFRPWTVPRIPFSLPAPRLTCLPVLSDLPVLTLTACPPITDYPACSLSDGLLDGLISRFRPCLPVHRLRITLPASLSYY